MAQPYVGEIRMFAGNFAPAGWMFCEGQLLPISENETLFQLIGTTYGGDGQSTFALPDLRGRVPIHMGNGFVLAETGGTEEVTLTVNQIPAHSHAFLGSLDAGTSKTFYNRLSHAAERRGSRRTGARHRPTAIWPLKRCRPTAVANPIQTFSRISASTSSSRCSARFFPVPEPKRMCFMLRSIIVLRS